MEIARAGQIVFAGATEIARIRRPLPSLVEWLFRDNEFPHGCYLMTGTGIVPADDFTLEVGDEIRITIDAVGTLVNHVARDQIAYRWARCASRSTRPCSAPSRPTSGRWRRSAARAS